MTTVKTTSRAGLFAPRYFIEMDGKPFADIMQYIMTFEFTDNEKESDELVLGISNQGLRWQDDLRFGGKQTRLKVRWGYPGDMSDIRQMVVTKVTPTFPSNGVPALSIQAMDLRRALDKQAHPKNWGPVSSSSCAAAIARRYGLGADIEDSGDARKESRVQGCDTTDMAFLLALAEKLHWDCFIEDGKLHFHRKRLDEAPQFEFEYFTNGGGTLLSVDSDLDLRRVSKTGTASVDPKNGTASAASGSQDPLLGGYSINTDDGKGAVVGSPQMSQDGTNKPLANQSRMPNGSEPLICPVPESDSKVAGKQAAARQGKQELNALTASVSVIGTPKLKSKHNIKLVGIGKAYSGTWKVTSARHTIRGTDYAVSCELKRNAKSTGKKTDKKSDPNAAPRAPDGPLIIETDVGKIRP